MLLRADAVVRLRADAVVRLGVDVVRLRDLVAGRLRWVLEELEAGLFCLFHHLRQAFMNSDWLRQTFSI